MEPRQVKNLLFSLIHFVSEHPQDYCFRPDTDFTRNRKLPMDKLIAGIIGLNGGSLSREILRMFHYSQEAASVSAFIQQRRKLKPEALEDIFLSFTKNISASYTGLQLLAVDGTDLQIAPTPEDQEAYCAGKDKHKPYNFLHVNALYDLRHQIYLDAIIQKSNQQNEHLSLCSMVDRSQIPKAIVLADRGYESYNDMAHIQEKGWYFLIRIKDGMKGIKSSFALPDTESFDVNISLKLTRRQTNEVKELIKDQNNYRLMPSHSTFDYLPTGNRKHDPTVFYELHFRIVRFLISDDCYETVLTNLDPEKYPAHVLKRLYAKRWGIETSFRNLKYTVGLLRLHSKKMVNIFQEIFAHFIMYNFAEMITSHVVIYEKQREYTYKANFSVAVYLCKAFYMGDISPPDLEAAIARNLVPVRPDRHRDRNLSAKTFQGFLYRIA